MPAPALPRDQPPLLGPGQRSRGPVARPGRGAAAVSWHRAAATQAELPENDCDQEEWCDDKHLNRIVSGGEYSFTVCPPSLPLAMTGLRTRTDPATRFLPPMPCRAEPLPEASCRRGLAH